MLLSTSVLLYRILPRLLNNYDAHHKMVAQVYHSDYQQSSTHPTEIALQLHTWWLNKGSQFASVTSCMTHEDIEATPERLIAICKHLNPTWTVTRPVIVAVPQGQDLQANVSNTGSHIHIASPSYIGMTKSVQSQKFSIVLTTIFFEILRMIIISKHFAGRAGMYIKYELIYVHIREAVFKTTVSVLL
jgi:hypothetical protein